MFRVKSGYRPRIGLTCLLDEHSRARFISISAREISLEEISTLRCSGLSLDSARDIEAVETARRANIAHCS